MQRSETPLRRSKAELRAAERAVQRMREAGSYEEYAEAWQTFLDRLEKVWVKAERECQDHRTRFEPWQAKFKASRRDDELLRYLHQARHADQHTVQPITAHSAGGFQLALPPATTVKVEIDWARGRVTVTGPASEVRPLGPGYLLLPIQNRGRDYPPPKSHLGADTREADPLAVAELGLAFYRGFLDAAEAEFFGRSTGPGDCGRPASPPDTPAA